MPDRRSLRGNRATTRRLISSPKRWPICSSWTEAAAISAREPWSTTRTRHIRPIPVDCESLFFVAERCIDPGSILRLHPESVSGFRSTVGSSLPRSSGSTLLETSSTNDFTFVRLNQPPAGRFFWDGRPPSPPTVRPCIGCTHPEGLPASYTEYTKVTNPSGDTCGWSTSNYHFEEFSSAAPSVGVRVPHF